MGKWNEPEFVAGAQGGVLRTATAKSALAVLLSPDFNQLNLFDYYTRLASELKRDFSNIRFVSRYVSLFFDGPEHKRLRKLSAEFLHGRADALMQFEHEAAALFRRKLTTAGKLEMLSEIIEPLFEMAAQAISGLPYMPEVSSALTVNNSLKVMRKMDIAFGDQRRLARLAFPDDSADTHGIRVAFSTLGVEPLGASLAASFAVFFKGADGARICELPWGEDYLATGVAALGRTCARDPLQRYEVDMSRFPTEGPKPHYVFGAGAHACLGRKNSLSLWALIGKDLARNKMRVRHISTKANTHKVLNFPSELIVEMSHE